MVGELLPTANYTVLFETPNSPLISLGTSSDRIFSPEGSRSYTVTFGKSIPHSRLAPYFAVNWSTWEDRLTYPFGINYSLHQQWDAMIQHDGRNTHWLLTNKTNATSISLLLVKGRHWGISAGFRF